MNRVGPDDPVMKKGKWVSLHILLTKTERYEGGWRTDIDGMCSR